MIRRIIQHRQAKCNFCFEWFIVKSQIKNCLQVCDSCLDKALNTSCLKVPSASGEFLYQLYLIRNHLPMQSVKNEESTTKTQLIEEMQEVRNQEIQKMLDKWKNIEQKFASFDSLSSEKLQAYRKILDEAQKQSVSFHIDQTKKVTELKKKQNEKVSRKYINPIKEEIIATPKNQPYSPLKTLRPRKAISPHTVKNDSFYVPKKKKKEDSFQNTISCIYPTKEKQNVGYNSTISPHLTQRRNFNRQKSQSSMKKSDISHLSFKIQKDLEAIKQDSLKSRIYAYLETETSVPSTLLLLMTLKIYDAIRNTNTLNKCIELVLFDISDINIRCYLEMLEWKEVEVFKLVKVGLTDEQFSTVLQFLKGKRIQTLVATSNKMTEKSCRQLLNIGIPSLKNIYLGRNKMLKFKVREQLKLLEKRYYLYL